jgi:hypothetical protein
MPSLDRPAKPMPFRAITILLALLLVAHVPMMLNDGVYMDDWMVLKLRPDYIVDLDFLLNGAGHPIFFSYDYFVNLTGNPVLWMKTLAFAGIFLGATCAALVMMRLDLLSRREAVGFSLIVWTYPGYQLWAGKANAVYVFSFGLLFVGAWLLTLAFNATGARRIRLRAGAALIFFLSFALNSTMVLYAFVTLALFLATWRTSDLALPPLRHAFMAARRCVIGYPELALLPLIYWAVLNICFKRVGVYAGHYDVHFPSASELGEGWKSFLYSGYRDVLRNAAHAAIDNPALFIATSVLIFAALFALSFDKKQSRLLRHHSITLPILFCPVIFLALSLPYLVAGLRPSEHFYESRHLLMFGIPLAVGLVAVKRMAEVVIGAGAAFAIVFGLASIVSIVMLWNGYIFMQARVLKQQSLLEHLATIPKPAATVFAISDGFMDYPSRYTPLGVSEVSGLLRLAWGNQPFFGFTLRAERPTVLQEMEILRTAEGSAFHHIDPSGPQATLSFQPSPEAASNAALVRHYFACRMLARCDVSKFLMQLADVTIEVGPIVGIEPLDHANVRSER